MSYDCKIDAAFSFRKVSDISRIQSFGEVFTPLQFVGEMLDMLDASTWTDPSTVLVEPTCGDGAFVVEMLRRRFIGLGRSRNKRTAVALAISSMWAIDIQRDNLFECRANVLRLVLKHLFPRGTTIVDIKADIQYIAAIIAAIHHHVRPGDGLKFKPSIAPFLALSQTEQKQAAQTQLDVLRTLLGGVMARSWLAEVFQPAQGSLIMAAPRGMDTSLVSSGVVA
jgi:hypothetical protein